MYVYYLLLVLLTVIWGSSYTIMKEFIHEVPNDVFQMGRYLVALLFIMICFAKEIKGIKIKTLIEGTIKVGLVSFLAEYCGAQGLERVSASQTAFLSSLPIVITPLIAYLHMKTKINGLQWVAVAVCFVGMMFLTTPWSGGFEIGNVYLLIAAIAFSYQFIGIQSLVRKYGAAQTTFTIFLSVFLGFCVMLLVSPGELITSEFPIEYFVIASIISGVLFTGIGWYLQAYVQKYLPIVTVSLFLTLEPVFAVIFDWIYEGNLLNMNEMFGGTLIVASLIICAVEIRIMRFVFEKERRT